MSDFQAANILWIIGALVLAVSALAVRRISAGEALRALLIWAAIGLVVYVAVANRYEIGAFFAGAAERLGLDEQQMEGETVRIRMSPDGHFWARVRLNGVERRMLVDSGATLTAISERTAQAAGIEGGGGFPVIIETANGPISARRGRVASLAVGALRTSDLGVVISSSFGEMDVLGMNFLSRLGSWRVEGRILVLEPGRETRGEAAAGAAEGASGGR